MVDDESWDITYFIEKLKFIIVSKNFSSNRRSQTVLEIIDPLFRKAMNVSGRHDCVTISIDINKK
jgi:hypothetical protein